MTAKRLLIPFVLLLSLSVTTSCSEDDYEADNIEYYLTSTTWSNQTLDSYGYTISNFVDFYDNGTGEWEVYSDNGSAQSSYFNWTFTDNTCSVIVLYFPDYGDYEYWTIDRIRSDYFSSYVSPDDPDYYPETEYFYQEFWSYY